MKKSIVLKVSSLIAGASVLATAFAGCTVDPSTLGDLEIDKTISDETITYTVFAADLNLLADSDRVLQHIEEKFNIKLQIEGAPSANWMESLSTRINADDPPDLFHFIPNHYLYTDAYYNFVEKGMILPISDYFSEEETPSLSGLMSCQPFSRLTIQDKYYFIPSITSPKGNVFYVRKDWMENVGITKKPETIEEFEDMLKRFTKNDPNQNGKKDTYGLTLSKTFEWTQTLLPTFNVTPEWTEVDGTWQYHPFTKNYRDFLQWMSGLYDKGYLKNEFFLYDDAEALSDFVGGKAGCIIQGWSSAESIEESLKRMDENAELDVIAMPDGIGQGATVDAEGNWWGGWSISYKAKEPYRLVKLLEYFHSEEGQMDICCGLEGIHYTIDEQGEVRPNIEERKKEPEGHFINANDQTPRGFYSFGTRFTYPYTIQDNRVAWKPINSIYANYDLVSRAYDTTRENVVYAFPNSSTELPGDFALKMISVYEKVETYSVRIVAGLVGLDEGLQAMKDEARDYPAMQEMMTEYTKTITSIK